MCSLVNVLNLFPMCRVVSAVVVTARNVNFALSSVPQSTEAYESARKILSMINDAEKVTYHGDKKIVRVKGFSYNLPACIMYILHDILTLDILRFSVHCDK